MSSASACKFTKIIQRFRKWFLFCPRATKVMRGCSAMMGAQNCFGPVVAFANADLMTSLVRDEWNFHGYIITDMISAY